jgi:hypothetical protein
VGQALLLSGCGCVGQNLDKEEKLDLNYMDLDGNLVDALKHLYTSMEDFFDKDSGCNFGKWQLVKEKD